MTITRLPGISSSFCKSLDSVVSVFLSDSSSVFIDSFIIARVVRISYYSAFHSNIVGFEDFRVDYALYVGVPLFLVLAFDMVLTFNTAYFDEEKGLVRSKRMIARNYLKFWFVPDLIWCLPIDPFIPLADLYVQ